MVLLNRSLQEMCRSEQIIVQKIQSSIKEDLMVSHKCYVSEVPDKVNDQEVGEELSAVLQIFSSPPKPLPIHLYVDK